MNLNPETLTTKIALWKIDESGIVHLVAMDNMDLNNLFENIVPLPNTGVNPESTKDADIQKEFRRFTTNPRALFLQKKTYVSFLLPPFDYLCNIMTNCLLCHTGAGQRSQSKRFIFYRRFVTQPTTTPPTTRKRGSSTSSCKQKRTWVRSQKVKSVEN